MLEPIDPPLGRSSWPGGAESRALSRRVEQGQLERLRPGLFREVLPPVTALEWSERPAEWRLRHVERAVAVALTRRSEVVFSHRTALAIHGFPFLPPWPDEVDVLEQPTSSRRSKRGIRTRPSTFADEDVQNWGEFWVTTPARTLADIALWLGPVFSVPALDAGLSRVSREDIRIAVDRVGGKRLVHATRALDFADPLSESPGESGSRVLMHLFGAPKPRLQLRHPSPIRGTRYFKTDFEWPELKKIGEFDGREKFMKDALLGGRSPGQAVYDEKLREDALRAEGNDVGRWGMPSVRLPVELRDVLVRLGIPLARGNVRLTPLW